MKKLCAILMSLIMLLALIPMGAISVAAASGKTGDCTWTVSGTHLTISGNGAMGRYDIYDPFLRPWDDFNVRSVTISYGVTRIGEFAFYGCNLDSVTIPDSVTTIDSYAFYECGLKSLTIGNGVTRVGICAFTRCFNLASVTIGSCDARMDFFDCPSLSHFDVAENNRYYSSVDGVLFNKDKTELVKYPSRRRGDYTIPNSVTSIGDYAFEYCTSLTSITIPDSVTSIGGGAFYNCTSLTSVIIPDSVTTIEDYAFAYCDCLTDVYYAGTVADKANISIGSYNDSLLNATWHYAEEDIIVPVAFGGNSVSEDVSGLAFQFTVDAIGMTTTNDTTAVYDNATVNGYKLLSMGAIATNGVASIDIPAVYLFDWSDTTATYAVRIIDIPVENYDTVITVTPYFMLEIDGVATTLYGAAQTASMNGAAK